MEIVAVIPARGGSKGIPSKNIVDVFGKPLISYTIKAALSASRVNRVIVSTDSTKIADVAGINGAEVIDRPKEISGDHASSESALIHVLEELNVREGYRPDILVFLQCTSPLTLAEDIDATIEKMLGAKADTALTVAPFHYYVWTETADGTATGVNHDKSKRVMRQQRENQFIETGAVYVMNVRGFLREKHRFLGKTVFHVTPAERCFEIDDPIDLPVVEAMLRFDKEQG